MAELVTVSAGEDSVFDVVLMRGLDGHAREGWSAKRKGSFSPERLAQDAAGAGVWSLGCGAASSRWLDHAMPIQDRQINLLTHLKNDGIGQRPLCFVTHSLRRVGGQGDAATTYGREPLQVHHRTHGVMFLATPRIGSDTVAKAIVKSPGALYCDEEN